ncbi:MAG: alpha/beta hydrolase [Actinobacteria bacterium]|jgi:pimeloyl-ACP methyl ester carboxylesterase|nr:alpha/beta hydrolase [Actinomycetota bacterium]
MSRMDERSAAVRWVFAAGGSTAAAALLGWLMPRGPMSTLDSISALALCAGVGVLAGRCIGRWGALLSPVLFALVFELVRIGADGPTVDRPVAGGVYAVLAFVVGRGFDGLVMLLPMLVGAFWGAAWRRRALAPRRLEGQGSVGLVLRRIILGIATTAVALLVVALARPGATAEIVDANGNVLPGSIAELTTVSIGGIDQSIMIRGDSVGSPVLLFLEGGPGGTAVGSMRIAGEPLEKAFVVATWDQRGTGRSASALEHAETITLEQSISDAIEVAEYLRRRFDERRVYLVGSSWGSTLGVLTAQRRPDLFAAYVGTGQMVNQAETDRRMYAESVAYAQREGDVAFADQLAAIGPPPYANMLDYPVAISSNPEWHDFEPGPDHSSRSSYPMNLFVPELTLTEQIRSASALVDTFATLYPQLQGIDFRRDVDHLDVPTYVALGSHEATGRSSLVREWFPTLTAPSKTLVTFESSGHVPHLDEPAAFAAFMTRVLQETQARLT